MKALVTPNRNCTTLFHEASIRSPLAHDLPARPGLQEGERAVLRLFGSEALGELHALGKRCALDQGFAAQVAGIGSPDSDLEGWSKLANCIPQYLISAHTLKTFIGNAVTPEFYEGIPATGRTLVAMSRGLQRFSSAAELELAVSDERALSLVPRGEPIWSAFAPSFLSTFRDHQLSAYKLRLEVQPGGREILAQMRDSSPASDKLSQVISATLLKAVADLDSEEVRRIRVIAREHQSKHWSAIPSELLGTGQVSRLRANDGSIFSPPRDLIDMVADLHHHAWLEARPLVVGGPAPSQSMRHAKMVNPQASQQLLVKDLNSIAALTLILQLGTLTDAEFRKITGGADSIEETGTFSKGSVGLTQGSDGKQNDDFHLRGNPKPSGSIHARRLESIESLEFVGRVVERVFYNELSLDRQELAPVFARIDHVEGGIKEREFLELVGQLREVHAKRMTLGAATSRSLLCASPAKLDCMVRSLTSDEVSPLGVLQQVVAPDDERAIRDLVEERTRIKRSLLGQACERLGSQQGLTELMRPEQISTMFPAIEALVTARVNDHRTESFKREGGILTNDFTPQFFARHFTERGSILIRQKPQSETVALDGMFVYGRPGYYPKTIAKLAETITQQGDLSFATLFVTATDRAPGTYISLLRGMVARLALDGARYSLGTVAENNLRHKELLEKLGHRSLDGAPLYLDAYNARFIPMLWELP